MKKRNFIVIFITMVCCITACHSTRNLQYQLPAEMSMAVQTEYAKLCEKGKILYELNCAHCHTKRVAGKYMIPDFTPEQLETYQIRAANERHEAEVSEEKVSAEELGYIITYLTYKKRNAPPKVISLHK